MDRMVAQLNIENFQKQLAAETDEKKRQTLRVLLSEEETKLAALNTLAKGKTESG